ncbi:MAG TPA: 16S rRNA (adenine(1518)-N(6)/adenine(1519)-N(6))-dimethyltransferase RsmA [Nitrosopumilaceae archaeon]|nr:16S rRNA (adenine(1518)-N(6)/adenine(1519)-N(6))-dimethyltransferase RsmA [Nitrosopumilaceae archaeon]
MKKRQLLGQHFLVSQSTAKSIVDFAEITKKDTVLEIGTGRGIMIPYLCETAKKVISVEKDKGLYSQALEKFENFPNLTLKQGDGFKMDLDFTIFASNLPYSESRNAIEWLAQKKFSHGVIMVQKEFAEKLIAKPGSKNHKAITVIANHCAEIKHMMNVKRSDFSPSPKVESVVLKLTKKQQISKDLINTVNKLFSYRRKTLHNVAKQFGVLVESNERFENLTNGEIINLAKEINKN